MSLVARASRVLVSASRRNELFYYSIDQQAARVRKVRDSETPSPARETHALPRPELARTYYDQCDSAQDRDRGDNKTECERFG